MDNDVPHLIGKLHKVGDCFVIPVTAWVGNSLMLSRIGYVRVGGKDGGSNSLAPAVAEIRYAVALGIGLLVNVRPVHT